MLIVINVYAVIADVLPEDADTLLDFAEKYVTVKLYTLLFCPPTCDDEQKDLQIQRQIRSLHWVTAAQLDTMIDEHCMDVRTLVDQAITGTLLANRIHQ